MAPGLYIVSTPIGNLRDITFRALDVLAGADLILAEDTRITRRLLETYGVTTTMRAYHDHNAAEIRPEIIAQLEGGARIAQVSDAGTPLVSDPGFKLARDAIDAGIGVIPIPGASAALAGLAAAGLPTDAFLFAGFAPPKSGKRAAFFETFVRVPATLIFYESGPRLADSLAAMADVFGPRPAAVARELTKRFEETVRGDLPDLAARYAESGAPKGEIVVLVGPPSEAEAEWDDARIDTALKEAMEADSVKDAAAVVAKASGLPRRDLYQRALALKSRA
ncbi:16S rRNA (cytidine(1402)-2'-O)-methyltransferase [Euryhalocaulis sp.]|uniref:16S rRNA (cytidine(1402)-2'-O)-methyltransferase n=1 Tax=Euryhalocaulis sp. TaxID=2744307 RepID=UPI00257F80B2|nr:16S rRNA (cytidine(1402)-2'-O)-methyltransferase [Euryhalocaulis sp.]